MGYVWCDGYVWDMCGVRYVWDMCGVRYANNLLKNPATKRLSGKMFNFEDFQILFTSELGCFFKIVIALLWMGCIFFNSCV